MTIANTSLPLNNRGAVSGENVSLTLTRCTIRGNPAGAVNALKSVLTIDRCTITDNGQNSSTGGALRVDNSAFKLINSTISNNRSNTQGILANDSPDIEIINSTLAAKIGDPICSSSAAKPS